MNYSTKLEDIHGDVIASLRLDCKHHSVSFTQLVSRTFKRKCITYRRHGKNGELLKPMHHRFEVKGGHSNLEALTENITTNNPLFKRLCQR